MNLRDLLDEVDVLGCKLTLVAHRTGWKCVASYSGRVAGGSGRTPADALEACLQQIYEGLAA